MKTISKKVYSFQELLDLESPNGPITHQAVQRVREKLMAMSSDSEALTENVWEHDWKCALEQIGFEDAELNWTGFASQGDGASFTAGINIEKILWFLTHKTRGKNCIGPTKRTGPEADYLPWVVYKLNNNYGYNKNFKELVAHSDQMNGEVKRTDSHYYHSLTCEATIDLYEDLPGQMNDLVTEFEKAVEELREKLCNAIYKDLEAEDEYFNQDEALIELDETQSFQWDESGRLEN